MLRRVALGAAIVAAAGLLIADAAQAQTNLPAVVVTTPSPVVRGEPKSQSAPAPRQAAPAAKQAAPTPSQASPQVAAQPAEASAEAGAATPVAGGPGVLIVPAESFASVTVLPQRELLAQPGATLTDALQYKPGITASNFAAGASRPIIRGLDNYRVRVQENGVGSHDVSALSEDHAVPVDPFSADRIEVVRGPATLRYGGGAIGGVVNAMNGRIPDAIPPRGASGEVRGGASSVDGGSEAAFRATAGAGNVAVYADKFGRHASDYQTPHGRQLNTSVDSEGHAFGTSFIGKDGYAGVSYARFSSLYGIPGSRAAAERKRIDMEQDKWQSRGEWRLGGAAGVEAVRYWLGHSVYAHNELGFNAQEGRDETGSRFTNKETEGRLEVQHAPVTTVLGRLTGAVGIQFGRRGTFGQSFEGDNLLDPARTRTNAAFLFEELQMSSALRLQGAVRYEHNRVQGTALDLTDPTSPVDVRTTRTFKPMSGSGGVLYDLPAGLVFRVTGQYTERAPDATELYSRGAHEATGTFEIGDRNLQIEQARTAEIGLRKVQGSFRFDASIYHTEFKNFIFKRLTGLGCGDRYTDCQSAGGTEEELRELRFSQRDANFKGAELIGQLDIAPVWRGVWGIEGQYDFVQARFADGQYVPRIPPHRAGAGLYYRDRGWLAKIGFLHAFRQEHVAVSETPTSGYTLLNAELSYTYRSDPKSFAPEVTIGVRGDNLLNEDVRNHVSFKKDEVLLPGANVRLFGSIKLQ